MFSDIEAQVSRYSSDVTVCKRAQQSVSAEGSGDDSCDVVNVYDSCLEPDSELTSSIDEPTDGSGSGALSLTGPSSSQVSKDVVHGGPVNWTCFLLPGV